MITNKSMEMRIEPSGWHQVTKRGKYNPAVYQTRYQQRPIPAPIYVASHPIVTTGRFTGEQRQRTLFSPMVLQQTPSHGATSPSPGFLSNYTAGQLLDSSVNFETGGLVNKAGTFGKNTIIEKDRSNGKNAANHELDEKKKLMLMHSGVFYQKATTNLLPVAPGETQYDPSLYSRRYPANDDTLVYQGRNQQVYPRGYTTDYVSQNAQIWSDSFKSSNHQKAATVVSPARQRKEGIKARGVYNNPNSVLSTSAIDTVEEKRKLALKHLLIRPITLMKGEA